MKKPKLPKGDWQAHYGHCALVLSEIDGDFLEVAMIDYISPKSDEEEFAVAQAISAVPGMIEELIKDYKLWLSIKNNSHDGELVELAETRLLQLQPVLKKAGVEL